MRNMGVPAGYVLLLAKALHKKKLTHTKTICVQVSDWHESVVVVVVL